MELLKNNTGPLHVTNIDADQLLDWPTVTQLIQMYGGVQ